MKKTVKRTLIIALSTFVVLLGVLFSLWFHYANKYNLLREYTYDGHKDVYILGTIDNAHFNRFLGYSFEDVCNVIDNLDPDLIMITAREDHYRLHGIIDGPIDMSVAYAKAIDNEIPVKMVDWWMIDDIYPEDASTNLRDDNIYIKISRNLKNAKPNEKILIITGVKHFYEQIARFEVGNLAQQKINNKKDLFKSPRERGVPFTYPPLTSKSWRDRVYFYAYTLPTKLKHQEHLNGKLKQKYTEANHDKFYRKVIKYCKLFLDNDLYK